MNSFFSLLFFFLLFIIAIGEFILSAFWVPFYFRFGIPLYRQSFQLPHAPADLGQYINNLESQLPRAWWQAAVVFRALGPHELAFRQHMMKNSRNALHGRVLFDPLSNQLSITGYFYWTLLFLPLSFLAMGFFELLFLPSIAFLVLILLFNIAQQRRSYQRVATAVQQTLGASQWLDHSPEPSPYDPFAPAPSTLPGLSTTELVLIGLLLVMLFITGAVFAVYWFGR
ncbi:MAG TPA: hypothetical protein PLD25_27495 [Chloroflexota bacterium]|nr:hypothetical protein [Chloroflexota bacterium]HUM68737.1 hypothetical protein [Chloroflexota bacterium]